MAGKYAFLTRSWISPDFGGRFGSPSAQLVVDRAGELAEALATTIHVVTAHTQNSAAEWMAASGGVAIADWAGVENLEERVDGAEAIDPVVLTALREVSS